MVAALEFALAAGIVVVGVSYLLAVRGRLNRTAVRAAAATLGLLGVASATLLAVGLAVDRWSWRELAVVCGGFLSSAAAELGVLALARGLAQARSVEELESAAIAHLDATIEAHAQARVKQLEQTLARERAETAHLLAEQERRLREERRAGIEQEIEAARGALSAAVNEAQQRVEHRLGTWSADLERAQQQLKARLEALIRHQADALKGHEARLAEHAAEVQGLGEHQSAVVVRMRSEVERIVQESLDAARSDIETHATERRRALHEVGERLRARERSMREQIERESTELKAELAAATQDVERRHLEQLERSLDRTIVRLSEDAERQFDRQIREARERTAERLSRELEMSMEHFMKAAESDVINRIAEAAQGSAARFQRQIDDLVRAAEVQTAISDERIRALTDRLEKSVDAAHVRLNDFEAHVELELSTKLAEMERALRAAGQTVDRAQSRS